MAGKYFVHIPKDSSVYGPYSLVKAKQFARIGSQYGAERVVTRGPSGRQVRVYADGARSYPVTAAQLRGLSRGEVPKTLAVRNGGRGDGPSSPFEGFSGSDLFDVPDESVPPRNLHVVALESLRRGDVFTLGGKQRWLVVRPLDAVSVWVCKEKQSSRRRKDFVAHLENWEGLVRVFEGAGGALRPVGEPLDEGVVEVVASIDYDAWQQQQDKAHAGKRNPRGGLVQVLVYAGPGRNRLTLTPKGDDPTDPDVWAEVSRDALPLNQRERVTLARGGAVWGIVNGEWFDTMVEETLERRGFGRAEWGVSNGALLEDAYFEQVIGMSEQEFAESPPPGFSYRGDMSPTGRRASVGHTVLGPAFFQHEPNMRRYVLYHEVGHDLMRDFNNDWKDVLEPFRLDRAAHAKPTVRSGYDNPFGLASRPEEMVADVYAAMFAGEERWYESEKYKALFRRAREVAGRLGLPLPENV